MSLLPPKMEENIEILINKREYSIETGRWRLRCRIAEKKP